MPSTYTKHKPGMPLTTNAQRIKRSRQRRKDAGDTYLSVWLTPEVVAGLYERYFDRREPLCHGVTRLLKALATADFDAP